MVPTPIQVIRTQASAATNLRHEPSDASGALPSAMTLSSTMRSAGTMDVGPLDKDSRMQARCTLTEFTTEMAVPDLPSADVMSAQVLSNRNQYARPGIQKVGSQQSPPTRASATADSLVHVKSALDNARDCTAQLRDVSGTPLVVQVAIKEHVAAHPKHAHAWTPAVGEASLGRQANRGPALTDQQRGQSDLEPVEQAGLQKSRHGDATAFHKDANAAALA